MNIINAVNTTEILILKWLLLCYLSFILLAAAPLHMAQRPTGNPFVSDLTVGSRRIY